MRLLIILLIGFVTNGQIPGADTSGVADATSFINTWINGAGPWVATADATYRIAGAGISATSAGDQIVDWNGATIITNESDMTRGILVNKSSGRMTFENLFIDGLENLEVAIETLSEFYFEDVDVRNLYTTNFRAIAFEINIFNAANYNGYSELKNCNCDNVDAQGDNQITDPNGVGGCIWINWQDSSPSTTIVVDGGSWTNVWAEDGDVIKTDTDISSVSYSDTGNVAIFRNMYIEGWQRRAGKFRSSNNQFYNNEVVSGSTSHPDYKAIGGVGSVCFLIESVDSANDTQNNHIHDNIFRGTAGYLPEIIIGDIDGFDFESNTLIDATLSLNSNSQDVTIRNNNWTGASTEGSPIKIWHPTVGYDVNSNGPVIIDNNTATQPAGSGGTGENDWSAFVDFDRDNSDLDNIEITDNLVFTNTNGSDTVYGLFWAGNASNTTLSDLTINNNVVVRQGTSESDEILRIDENMTGTNVITNNKLLIASGTSADLIDINGSTGSLTETGNTVHLLNYDYSGLGVGSSIAIDFPINYGAAKRKKNAAIPF